MFSGGARGPWIRRRKSNDTGSHFHNGAKACVIFCSELYDREELSGRMAEHPALTMTVTRFVQKNEMDVCDLVLRPSGPSQLHHQSSNCERKPYLISLHKSYGFYQMWLKMSLEKNNFQKLIS